MSNISRRSFLQRGAAAAAAFSLVFFAMSGLFMIKGKNGIAGRGKWYLLVGCMDPFPLVAGRGIRKLEEAGIDVTVGVLEEECREQCC